MDQGAVEAARKINDEYETRTSNGSKINWFIDKAIDLQSQLVLLREQISAVLRICSGEDQVESSEDDAVLKAIERILKGEPTNV